MYRFHPSVKWGDGYPKRGDIVSQIKKLWENYGLEKKTKFNCKVEKTYKDKQGRWIINDPSNGRFDGILAAVGTCGDPKMPKVNGQEKFKGEIYHSSELDGKDAKGKRVIIIGGGASAVEALEFVDEQQAEHTDVLARSEKWIIPRNAIIDMMLSMNPFGRETMFSWIPENFLRIFFYRDLADISPPSGSSKGLFTETPMVNSRIFDLIRSGKAKWLRGDIIGFDETGVMFNRREQGVPKGGPGNTRHVDGDICIMATGFTRPSLGFLPEEDFEEKYSPPNWYLQVFPPRDLSVCANNCTYVNAIGTVGNFHVGIYTRFLLMFLVDPLTRPSEFWMKTWVDLTRWVKMYAPGGALDFFTYAELIYWFLFSIAINPFRWKWILFVLFGIGPYLPKYIVAAENRWRDYDAGFNEHQSEKPVNGI